MIKLKLLERTLAQLVSLEHANQEGRDKDKLSIDLRPGTWLKDKLVVIESEEVVFSKK